MLTFAVSGGSRSPWRFYFLSGRYIADDKFHHWIDGRRWPRWWAVLATTALHGVAILAVVFPRWPSSTTIPSPETVRVGMVQAIPVKLITVTPSPQMGSAAAVPAATSADRVATVPTMDEVASPADAPASSSSGNNINAKSNAPTFTTIENLRQQQTSAPQPVAAQSRKKQKISETRSADAVAVYDVLVDSAGNIRGMVLTRSSGVPILDEAGKKMIYDSLVLDYPVDDVIALRVTLHFR